MNQLNEARAAITCAIDETYDDPNESARQLRMAQVHAQIASAESLARIAECLETLVEDRTPDAGETEDPFAQGKVGDLIRLISELSEEATRASWHIGCEYDVWAELAGGFEPPCQLIRDENERDQLRELSDAIGGWVAWDEAEGDAVFVPMDEWRMRYAEWREKAWRSAAQDATPDPLADLAPDWSQEEDWVRFYAIDAIGRVRRFDTEPIMDTDGAWWMAREFTRSTEPSHEHGRIPDNVDWTRLKWQRPQAEETAERATALSLCPFCKDRSVGNVHMNLEHGRWHAGCRICGARGPIGELSEAMDAWNRAWEAA